MINPSKMAHFKLWLSGKGWKVVSKLSIINLGGQREEPAWDFYRNNTVKEYVPHWELGIHSVFWWPGHRPTFPPSPFCRRKKKKNLLFPPLSWVSVFIQEARLLCSSPPSAQNSFLQGATNSRLLPKLRHWAILPLGKVSSFPWRHAVSWCLLLNTEQQGLERVVQFVPSSQKAKYASITITRVSPNPLAKLCLPTGSTEHKP